MAKRLLCFLVTDALSSRGEPSAMLLSSVITELPCKEGRTSRIKGQRRRPCAATYKSDITTIRTLGKLNHESSSSDIELSGDFWLSSRI